MIITKRFRNILYFIAFIYFLFFILHNIQNEKFIRIGIMNGVDNQINDMVAKAHNVGNDGKSIRIFCMIFTIKKNLDTKAKAINQTWAKECDKYFFIANIGKITTNTTLEYSYPLPIIHPADLNIETYRNLTYKMFRTIRDVYLRYNDYDWYLKADDDTFMFVDNLREFLMTKNASSPVTYGYDYKRYVERGYHSGGAGYVLSNAALRRIGPELETNNTLCKIRSGNEDVEFARCLRQVGVYPEKSIDEFGRERFHPLSIQLHYEGIPYKWMHEYASNPLRNGSDCCSDTSISFHYIYSTEIRILYEIWTEMKTYSKKPYNFTSVIIKYLQSR